MSKTVIVQKKSGKTEPFDPEKVRRSVQKAAIDAGYTLEGMADPNLIDEVTTGIIEEAEEKREIKSATIRESILNRLEKTESSIAQSWKKFEERYKSIRR